jgi:hypothetical protein
MLQAGRADDAIPLLQGRYYASPVEDDVLQSLASAQELNGQPCEALVSWQMLYWSAPKLRGVADQAVARLDGANDCPGVRLREETTLQQKGENGYWTFPVGFSGHDPVWLGLSSDAPLTYLSAAAFEGTTGATLVAEGVQMRAPREVLVGDLYRLDQLELGGVAFSHVDVLVVPTVSRGVDGFLGLNVVSRMTMSEKREALWVMQPH